MKVPEGWITTDASCNSLQLAKKISDTTWIYREWIDTPMDIAELPLTCEFKLDNWNDDRWREEEIDLWDYTENEVQYYLDAYSYKLDEFIVLPDRKLTILVKDENCKPDEVFSRDFSVQICCECIFEHMNYTVDAFFGNNNSVKSQLEYLRRELRAERISYGELQELQSLAEFIDPNDVELREAAGLPEFKNKEE